MRAAACIPRCYRFRVLFGVMVRDSGKDKQPRDERGLERASEGRPADLPRAQVDVLLERIAEEARQCLRANPDDPAVFQRVVDRTRELLRVTALEHHVHIGDTAQHLIDELGEGINKGPGPDIVVRNADLMRAEPLGQGPVEDAGVELAADPFDIESYAPEEEAPDGDTEDTARAAPEAAAAGAASATPGRDRRKDDADPNMLQMRRGLTDRQLATLDTMSNFGWTLRFVRRPMFHPPIPVAFDRNTKRFVVIEADGSVNEDPDLQIRD